MSRSSTETLVWDTSDMNSWKLMLSIEESFGIVTDSNRHIVAILHDNMFKPWSTKVLKYFSDDIEVDELDENKDGTLSAQDIARAFEGNVSVVEVDAAVHNVLVEVAARHKKSGTQSLTFEEFIDFISSENGISSSLFPDRLDGMEEEEEEEDEKVGSGWMCLCS